MLLGCVSTGKLSASASVFKTEGIVGNNAATPVAPIAGTKVALTNVGENAPTHIGVQKPQRPADLVGFRSPPNFKRWLPFCHTRLSTISKRRELRPCGALKFGPTAGMLAPTKVKMLGRLPATQGAEQSDATAW